MNLAMPRNLKTIGWCSLVVLIALYVVGAVSHGSLRHEVQTLPLWVPVVAGFNSREFACWCALPCFLFWLFLLGWSHFLSGQFSPTEILLTERGTFFGYNRLVNDFTGLEIMKSFNCPVVFDVTHSTQQPAGQGNQSGGNPRFSPLLARAAVAAGVDGLFLECHPDPKNAKSDAATMLDFATVETMLTQCAQIAEIRKGWNLL